MSVNHYFTKNEAFQLSSIDNLKNVDSSFKPTGYVFKNWIDENQTTYNDKEVVTFNIDNKTLCATWDLKSSEQNNDSIIKYKIINELSECQNTNPISEIKECQDYNCTFTKDPDDFYIGTISIFIGQTLYKKIYNSNFDNEQSVDLNIPLADITDNIYIKNYIKIDYDYTTPKPLSVKTNMPNALSIVCIPQKEYYNPGDTITLSATLLDSYTGYFDSINWYYGRNWTDLSICKHSMSCSYVLPPSHPLSSMYVFYADAFQKYNLLIYSYPTVNDKAYNHNNKPLDSGFREVYYVRESIKPGTRKFLKLGSVPMEFLQYDKLDFLVSENYLSSKDEFYTNPYCWTNPDCFYTSPELTGTTYPYNSQVTMTEDVLSLYLVWNIGYDISKDCYFDPSIDTELVVNAPVGCSVFGRYYTFDSGYLSANQPLGNKLLPELKTYRRHFETLRPSINGVVPDRFITYLSKSEEDLYSESSYVSCEISGLYPLSGSIKMNPVKVSRFTRARLAVAYNKKFFAPVGYQKIDNSWVDPSTGENHSRTTCDYFYGTSINSNSPTSNSMLRVKGYKDISVEFDDTKVGSQLIGSAHNVVDTNIFLSSGMYTITPFLTSTYDYRNESTFNDRYIVEGVYLTNKKDTLLKDYIKTNSIKILSDDIYGYINISSAVEDYPYNIIHYLTQKEPEYEAPGFLTTQE